MPSKVGYVAGEARNGREISGTVYDPAQGRRWRLQRKAQGLLSDNEPVINRYGIEVAKFKYRVCMCQRGTNGGAPSIRRSPDRLRARYVGLQTCGSVWHCPICAPKVAAARRDEMNEAISAWITQGHEVFFLTYTMQHNAERYGAGRLELQLDHLGAALSSFKSSRGYKCVRERAGYKGSIRALEAMFGEMNGWHTHTHDLMFAKAGAMPVLRELRKLWARKLIKCGLAGLLPGDIGVERFKKLRNLLRHCLTVQDGQYAAEYVAKFGREPESERGAWGIGSEMTRAHLKRGRGLDHAGVPQRCDHASPWGLLNDALDGDKRSGELFREFGQAFHGKRQLVWSTGLKEFFFGVAGRSDDDIAAEPDARCTEHVIELGPVSWGRVLAHNARWDLLQVAATKGAAGVVEFLHMLEHAPPSAATHSDFYTEQFNRLLGWNPVYERAA